jgi:sulfate adenylyltransferase subunit 2
MVDDDRLQLEPNERPELKTIRYPLSGAIESNATTIEQIVAEMQVAKVSERQGRLIDSDEAASRRP